MQLVHRFRVPVPVEEAWDAFSRLERVAPCLPGAVLTATGPDTFRGSVAVKIGPVPLTYTGTGSYLERHPSRRRVSVQARGDDDRGLGGLATQVTTSLHARGPETEVKVVAELELTGRPARYGPEVVTQAADKLLDQFARTLAERFATGTLAPPTVFLAEPGVPGLDPGAPADVGVTGPLARAQPRHGAGRSPVLRGERGSRGHAPRRAKPRSGPAGLVRHRDSAALARRLGPVTLVAVAVSVLAFRRLRRW